MQVREYQILSISGSFTWIHKCGGYVLDIWKIQEKEIYKVIAQNISKIICHIETPDDPYVNKEDFDLQSKMKVRSKRLGNFAL